VLLDFVFSLPLADDVICLTTARFEKTKGYQFQLTALKQLRRLPEWERLHFVWIGAGSTHEQVSATLEREHLRDRVHLLGHRWDIADWLDAADMFILPSMAEGMPLAIMEAMGKGLPILASAVSGIPEQLGPTGCLLPDPNHQPQEVVQGLVETISSWARDPDLRQQVGEGCRQRAAAMFREERMLRETRGVVERALLPPGDYVAPGLEIVRPDECFPNMVRGGPRDQPLPFLRREIPHAWYADRRWPGIGFLTRDEAVLLYNLALQFREQRALAIGCGLGWSACHLALAGVELDVVDPVLADPNIRASVEESLAGAGVQGNVTLHSGCTPEAIDCLAERGDRRWSLCFVDSIRGGGTPIRDAQACERWATDDALVVFHNLAALAVTDGWAYLGRRGWRLHVYQTMQVMGIAWRGNVTPLEHQPDPNVNWTLPQSLFRFISMRVSG
jgi:hypothetical protein